jgi:D-alanyl-lipoteichoic acid acyltransferase DltB (MBOAT superfamily)
LERETRFNDRQAESGLGLMLAGLFKKICIADVLGVTLVDPVFSAPSTHSSWTLLIAMYGYAFQIYYDFAGYSDVAIGAARMLGFSLPINFDRPYLATSLRDFWRRWHISLSTWLRDYLYIPLGGGRGSAVATARNLAIVMLLGGLWHGAAWGFMLWGAAHGTLLGLGRLVHAATGIDGDRADQPLIARAARVAVTFHLVAGCFVLFRTVDFGTASAYFARLVRCESGSNGVSPLAYAVLALAMVVELAPRRWFSALVDVYTRTPAIAQGGLIAASVLLFSILGDTGTPFIYFQF